MFPSESSVTLEDLAHKLCIDKVQPREIKDNSVRNKTGIQNSKSRELCNSSEDNHMAEQSDVLKSNNAETDESVELVERKEPVQVTSEDGIKTRAASDVSDINCIDVDKGDERDAEDLKIYDQRDEAAAKTIPYDKVVFIDSTWNQTKSICNDERLKGKSLFSKYLVLNARVSFCILLHFVENTSNLFKV